MRKTVFINHVLEILNEADNRDGIESLINSDLANVKYYIEKLYPAAWRRAVKLFPRMWFDTKSFSDAPREVDAPDGTGYVVLPEDFLALSSFRMKGWKSACLGAVEETPDINLKQSNEYLRGTPQRPVCVIRPVVFTQAGGLTPRLAQGLFYYSMPRSGDERNHVVELALYIPNVVAMPNELEFNENLYEPLAYICASTVLTSFEKNDAVKAMEEKILEMI